MFKLRWEFLKNDIIRLRFFAILAVIMIHSAAPFFHQAPGKPGNDFFIANIYDGLSRIAVPLFLMISGALLLHKDEKLSVFLKKRASKIIIPFIVWSIIYYLYKIGALFPLQVDKIHVKGFLKSFISGNVYFHLWYLYMIIPVYLFIPILRKLVQNTPTHLIVYFVVVSLLFENIRQFFHMFYHIEPRLYFTSFSGYISYILMGYLIYQRNFLYEYKRILYILGFFMLFITTGGTYMLDYKYHHYVSFFYEYLSFNVFIYAMATMMLFMEWNGKSNRIVNSISEVSFTVYFVHILFLNYFKNYLKTYHLETLVYIPTLILLTFISSYIFSLIISKIPILRKFLQ
jgi:surface polysaccharide O-acyltransferase-like enzyme